MATQRWKVVENVVAALQSATTPKGTIITPNGMIPSRQEGEEARQTDVVVQYPLGPRTITVAVEVRNKKKPTDVTEIEQLHAKHADIYTDRLCVVSTSGFTEEAKKKANRLGIELSSVEDVSAHIKPAETFQFGYATVTYRPERLTIQWPPDNIPQFDEGEEPWTLFENPSVVMVEFRDGTRQTLEDVFAEALRQLVDKDMSVQFFSKRFGGRLDCSSVWSKIYFQDGRELPAPLAVEVWFTSHVEHREAESSRYFTAPGGERVEAHLFSMNGADQQATTVRPPASAPSVDGWHELGLFTIGPAIQPQTPIAPPGELTKK